jgi:serine/threonine-protein kinase ULK/ATG1
MVTAAASMGELREAGHWVLDREIGSGSFAKVWRATHKQTQQVAAVKEINLDKLSKKLQESLASEVAVLKHTQHHNIVCLVDLIKVCVNASRSYISTALAISPAQRKLFMPHNHCIYWRQQACAPAGLSI